MSLWTVCHSWFIVDFEQVNLGWKEPSEQTCFIEIKHINHTSQSSFWKTIIQLGQPAVYEIDFF